MNADERRRTQMNLDKKQTRYSYIYLRYLSAFICG